ncbi:hypothetical protein ON010_g11596 [Phytophthora cinnamomi]|nr:hypothetical protein ON010_g11596 [Phytophthora cinnamomi]
MLAVFTSSDKSTTSATSPTLPRAVCSSKELSRRGPDCGDTSSGFEAQGWPDTIHPKPKARALYQYDENEEEKHGDAQEVLRRVPRRAMLLVRGVLAPRVATVTTSAAKAGPNDAGGGIKQSAGAQATIFHAGVVMCEEFECRS